MKNWVNVEVGALVRRDRDELKNMIDLQGDDIEKLKKSVQKFNIINEKLQLRN